MAGEITVNGRKKLATLQKEFSEAFNYLFIAFIDIADKDKKGQVNQIDCSKSISEVRTRVSNEELSLNGRTLIKNIEKYFESELGIYCQIGVHNYQGKTLYIPTDDAFNNSGLTAANKWAAENGCAAIGKINLADVVVVGEGVHNSPAPKVEKVEDKGKKDAEEKAKKDADAKAKKDAEEKAKLKADSEVKVKKELKEKSKTKENLESKPFDNYENESESSYHDIILKKRGLVLLSSINEKLLNIDKEMSFNKYTNDDKLSGSFILSDLYFNLLTISGDYSGLKSDLANYKDILQELSKFDNDYAKKKFVEMDSKLDNHDMDFKYWLRTAESNRKDKRKSSDSLKAFQRLVKRFTDIFEDFSYNGWTG